MFHKVFNSSNNKASLDRKLESEILFNLSDNNLSQNDLTGENIAKTEKAQQAIWQGIRAEKENNYKLAISYYRLAIEEDPESAKAYQLLSGILKKVRQQRQYRQEKIKQEPENAVYSSAIDRSNSSRSPNQEESSPYVESNRQNKTLATLVKEKESANSKLLPSPDSTSLTDSNFSNVDRGFISSSANKTTLDVSDRQSGKMILLPEVNTSLSGELMVRDNTAAAQVYFEQAVFYFEQKQWERSIQACQEAIRIYPNLGKAYKIWGNCLQRTGDTAGAMGIYAKALEVQPNMAEIYCNLGSIYAKKKNWQQAIEHYERSSFIDSNNATPYRNLAKVWDYLGEYEKSTACFFKALNVDPKLLSAQQHFELANNLLEEDKLAKAIACYKHCITIEPGFVNGYVRLADALEKDGQTEAALFYYKKLAKLQIPQQDRAGQSKSSQQIRSFLSPGKKQLQSSVTTPQSKILRLGESKPVQPILQLQPATAKTPQSEVESAIKAAKQQPQSADAIANLGNVYFKHQRWQRAISCYGRAIKLAPQAAEYYFSLGKTWAKANNLINANQAYYRGFTLKPESVSAKNHYQLGDKLFKQGQREQAVACYYRAIKLKPNFARAYLRLGQILIDQEKGVQAIKYLRQAIKLQPNNQEACLILGKSFLQQQNYEGAVSCFRQTIKLNPQSAESYHSLGDTLAKLEQWQPATQAYQKAIKLRSNYSWSYNNLGDVCLKLEQWSKAALCYQKAIALKPDFVWSHQNLGEACSKQEKWTEAIKCYRRTLKLRRDLPWTWLNLGDALGKIFNWSDAAKSYRYAIKLKPDFSLAHARLGDALVRQEQWDEAIKYYEQAIELDPGIDVSVYRNLKEALDRKKFLAQETAKSESIALEVSNWPYAPVQRYQPPATLPDGSAWPKISLVIPSYNQGEFIEETILSAIHQDYPNLECISIDGGSEDRTVEIIEKYRQHFSYAVSEPDSGQSNAINKGFRRATGEIFTWLNSDDRLAPGALYAIALAFYTSKADAVAGVCQIFKDGVEIEQHLTSCRSGKISLEDILDLENCWLKGKFFYQPEVMFTRAIWEKAGGAVNESLYYSMDYEMWARFAASGAKLEVIGFPVAQYRMHEKQKTSTMEKYQPELLQVRKSLRQKYQIAEREPNSVSLERKNLKVVVLNDTGSLGGAGIAHQRIAQALSAAGHQTIAIAGTLDWSLTPIDCTAEKVEQTIASLEPDLLVVGNVHNFQRPLDILERLTAKYLTMFVMHDQWLMTGRCGYTGGCEKYTTLCDAECPTWEEYPRLAPSKIAAAFTRKQKWLQSDNLLILADSKWLQEWARDTYLDRASVAQSSGIEPKIQHLYYGLDLNVFRPQDSLESRRQLDLPQDKFIILTGSQSLEDERKGFRYLLQALELAKLDNIMVLCFGHDFELQTDLEIVSIGYIDSPALLAYYYSAADLFVSPALEEAFGQTFIEAAACGTPAIGFEVGGIKEAVGNKISGSLVLQKNPQALAKAITELYRDRSKLELLSRLAPWHIANHFSLAASYHTIVNTWENSGWLAKLGISAVTKFRTDSSVSQQFLTIEGGNPLKQAGFAQKLPITVLMDRKLQGSGWFAAEEISDGVFVRWMKKLGSIIIEPVDTAKPLQLELVGVGAVDHQLLKSMTMQLNGNTLTTAVEYHGDGSWLCRSLIPANAAAAGAALLITIKTDFVKRLSPGDSRKGSLLVKSLTLKSQN